jgi:hypothetical protein
MTRQIKHLRKSKKGKLFTAGGRKFDARGHWKRDNKSAEDAFRRMATASYLPANIREYAQIKLERKPVLIPNYRHDRFEECDTISKGLEDELQKLIDFRNKSRVFEYAPGELMGALMVTAAAVYYQKPATSTDPELKFMAGQNKDYFSTPPTEEGFVAFFVRNKNGKLTAMLPEEVVSFRTFGVE